MTYKLTNFLGINNRLPDFDLRVSTRQLSGQWLRSADNVDINDAGKARRRNSTALVQSMTGAHSLSEGLLVRSAQLYAITLPTYTESLLKLLTSDAAMSYTEINGSTYYSNGADSGRVTAGVVYPLGIATPDTPTLALTGGGLLAGRYQVGVSYTNSLTGEESGISASGNIELTATGGVRVSLPGATPGADKVNVYLSQTNGEAVYWLAQVASGAVIYDAISLPTGRESTGRFEDPLPPGELFVSNGRLCSFAANAVYVGEAYRPGYYLPTEGYILFPSDVTLAVENQGGTYVATATSSYWIPGDLGNVQEALRNPLPYGAVRGTTFKHPSEPMVGWFSNKGVVLADTQGQITALTEAALDVVPPASGNSVVFESDGYRRVVSCGYCVNLKTGAATTYSDWNFTSTSGGYGTKPDGIYLLKSDGLVDASIGLGKLNFDTEELKHLPAVYLGVDAAEPMELRVQAPREVDYTYAARSSGEDLQMQRIDPGKGLRANWYDLTVLNAGGADFTLASVSFAPTASTRRI